MKIERRIELVMMEISKIEEEILKVVETGLKCVDDVFRVGLGWRNLCTETSIFYQKMEADYYRYKLEIL
jgi:hypothetical protein